MAGQLVLREDRGGVVVLTLNRVERRNAMVPDMMADLAQQFCKPAAKAFVLTGSGSAFCVGADLKWMGAEDEPAAAVATLVAAHHRVVRAMRAAPAPVVAAVNGAAAGGGMSLALAGDYCVAASDATFTAAYFRLGLTPDGGNSVFLPRAIGTARAMELLLTNRGLTAQQAHDWGLIADVVSPGELLERACSAAAAFAGVPEETLLTTRRWLDSRDGLEGRLDEEAAAVAAAARRPEFRQALDRFLGRGPGG